MGKLTVPSSADGLRELLDDGSRIQEFFSESAVRNGVTKQFLDKYTELTAKHNPDTNDDMRTQVQSVLFDMVRDNGGKPDGLGKALSFNGGRPQLNLANGSAALSQGKGAVYNKATYGHMLSEKLTADEKFDSIGDYFRAIRVDRLGANTAAQAKLVDKLDAVRRFQDSFSSEDPGSGGFLIPEIMRSELLQLALEEAIVRPRATVIPMSTLRVPIPAVDDVSHVSSLFGGVTFYWAEEASSLTESTGTFDRIVLDAKKLTGFFKVPNELLQDAPAFSGWFDQRIPAGLAWWEDVAFLTETGAGTPQGCIGAQNPAYVSVDRATTSSLGWADITSMYARMLPQSLNKAVWICAIDVFPQLAQITMSTPGIWMGGYNATPASNTPPVTIMGRPVYFTEKVGPANSLGDISFVDLSYYLIGDRMSVAVSSSDQFLFQNDQTAFRIIERVDGRPWLRSALTPHNNSSSTLSAYVGLSATHT